MPNKSQLYHQKYAPFKPTMHGNARLLNAASQLRNQPLHTFPNVTPCNRQNTTTSETPNGERVQTVRLYTRLSSSVRELRSSQVCPIVRDRPISSNDRMSIRPVGDVLASIEHSHSIVLGRFPNDVLQTPNVYLLPFPRYPTWKNRWKSIPPLDDVTRQRRRRHSTDKPRFPNSVLHASNVYLARFASYDRRMFVPL